MKGFNRATRFVRYSTVNSTSELEAVRYPCTCAVDHCDADLTATDLLARYPVHSKHNDWLDRDYDSHSYREASRFLVFPCSITFRDDVTSIPQRSIDAYCFG